MTDVFTKQKRSDVMSKIRGKDTKPEKIVRSYLHQFGFRFRLHKKGLPGRPDLWLPKYNAAIFINGCYWHRHRDCKYTYMPKQNREFWQNKFAANVVRDEENLAALRIDKIRVLVVWECELNNVRVSSWTLPKIAKWLSGKSWYREIPPPK